MRDIKPLLVSTIGVADSRQEHVAQVQELALKKIQYRAVWRSNYLIICPIDCHPFRQSVSAVLEGDLDRLFACLQRSTVNRILLSPQLPIEELCLWAELGLMAQIPVYVRLPHAFHKRKQWWVISAIFNKVRATLLLTLLSPAMLVISLVLLTTSNRVFAREWSVGTRGHLFQAMRFAFDGENVPASFARLGETRLAALPLWINVLRGEYSPQDAMSLDLSKRSVTASDLYSISSFSDQARLLS